VILNRFEIPFIITPCVNGYIFAEIPEKTGLNTGRYSAVREGSL